MPKPRKKSTTNANLEFQRKEFPKRIAAARKIAETALTDDSRIGKGHKPLTVKQRGRHQDVLKAANRVEKRLKVGKAPSREAVTKPGKTKTGFQKGLKKLRDIDPRVTTAKLKGVNDLITAGRKAKKSK